MGDFMKHIWIIHHKTSTNLFYRNFSEMLIDPDLLSGLLAALDNFSEVELKSQGISSIEMGGLRWAYSHHPELNLMLIGTADKSAHAEVMKARLEVIFKEFVTKYNITPHKMNSTLINVKQFENFQDNLDILVQQWHQAEALVEGGATEIFDLLGVFQNLFNKHLNILQKQLFYKDLDEIIASIKNNITQLKNSDDFRSEPELKKIDFSLQGWNLMAINSLQVEKDTLKRFLFLTTQQLDQILRSNLSNMTRLNSYAHEIFPYLIQQFDLLNQLDVLAILFRIFLI